MEYTESEKFKSKYRVDSARLKDWDYSSDGSYFVTICTKNREHFFGEIEHGEMRLSEIGKSAQQCWNKIPQHFPFVILDEFVVMPNHVHGILLIEKPNPVPQKPIHGNTFGPQSKNLASIIRGYKIGVTKFANQKQISFGWQPRYHDRVIRNESELNRIRKYIANNPYAWKIDRNNLKHIVISKPIP
jgi:REP element-mobilizing transposase RayT